jgi:hypothetical protein
MRTKTRLAAVTLSAIAAAACSSRPSVWDQPPGDAPRAFGLTSAAIVVDDGAHRAVSLHAHADQVLTATSLPIGHNVLATATSPDAARLFVLAGGDAPRRSAKDEYPSLTVIDGGSAVRFTMAEPLGNLAVDPVGRWAAAFAGSGGAGQAFVQNPNEIVLFDLSAPPGPTNPVSRTIRSFGGVPRRLTFTPTLLLPGGPRRLLVVETDQDVTLLDLDHVSESPPRPEITVRLTNGDGAAQLEPAGVVVDDGDPTRSDDARVAVRTSNDTNVITLQLGPAPAGAPAGGNDFFPTINLTDVGGIPSDIAFVRTDGGLRVAALVPTSGDAVLVDPTTSITEPVSLPAAYTRLSVVTDIVASGASPTDVALLWGAEVASSGVAFWTLGQSAGQPYRSVEVLGLADSIGTVADVPSPHPELKLLQSAAASGFYVLDLRARTAAPLTTLGTATLAVAPDGQRLWAFDPGTTQLASVDLATLHPVPLFVDHAVSGAFDVARDDGGRALVAVQGGGAFGATVFDALAPDSATARAYSAIVLGGLQ